MSGPRLYSEILLRIIEFSDEETMVTLRMVTEFKVLFDLFEASIVKNICRMFTAVCPNEGNSPFLLTYDLSGLERMPYSSLAGDTESQNPHPVQGIPELVHMDTFEGLKELQKRHGEIEVLLRSPYFRLQHGPGGTPYSWPFFPHTNAKASLGSLLERAISRCDVLADMEGRAVVDVGQPSVWYDYIPEVDGARNRFPPSTGPSEISQEIINGVLVPKCTLRLQVEYLQSLSLDSLIELYFLGTYLAECRQISIPRRVNMDLAAFFEEHLFQEAMLRHGSWFLFGEIRGFGVRVAHRRQLLEQIRKEFVLLPDAAGGKSIWHLGGLRMMLLYLLRERIGITKQGRLRTEIYKRVGAMIGAPDAFDNPPSLADRPLCCAQVNPWWL